jgi:hypothetical protein
MPLLLGLFSSSNNNYMAIGRVLGVMLFINLLILLPAAIGLALWLRGVEPPVWFAFLSSLAVYVPAMCLSAVGLIGGTAFTEKPNPEPSAS